MPREPIASGLDPLTEDQANAYRRLPCSFRLMLQAVYDDGWNGAASHFKGALIEADREADVLRARIVELEAAFDAQSDELADAINAMTPEQLADFRRVHYPDLHPQA